MRKIQIFIDVQYENNIHYDFFSNPQDTNKPLQD